MPIQSMRHHASGNIIQRHGSVDVILDFTDPLIKGMSVFHCHLLNHEDKGMMAKILFK